MAEPLLSREWWQKRCCLPGFCSVSFPLLISFVTSIVGGSTWRSCTSFPAESEKEPGCSSLLKSSICLLGMEGMHGTSELCICPKKMQKALDMSLSPWHQCDLQLSHLISAPQRSFSITLFSLRQKTHSSLPAHFLQQLDTHDASYLYFCLF